MMMSNVNCSYLEFSKIFLKENLKIWCQTLSLLQRRIIFPKHGFKSAEAREQKMRSKILPSRHQMITAESFSVFLESEGRHTAACPRPGHQDERQPSVWLSKKRHPCIYISKKMGCKGSGKRCAQEIREATVKGHLSKGKRTGGKKSHV